MSRRTIRLLRITAVMLALFAAAMTVLYVHITSLVEVRMLSSRQYTAASFQTPYRMLRTELFPEDIRLKIENHPDSVFVTELLVEIDNHTGHTFDWENITTREPGLYIDR